MGIVTPKHMKQDSPSQSPCTAQFSLEVTDIALCQWLFGSELPFPGLHLTHAFWNTENESSGLEGRTCLILRSLIYFELILIQGDMVTSSDTQISQQHLLKRLSFSTICFWHLCQKLTECSCVNSYPGPLFCSTGLHVYFCASTMLFLLLWLCNIVWSQVLWYLQHCSFCSVLPCLFMVFCVSKWTLG
jgi:hypothetical protein